MLAFGSFFRRKINGRNSRIEKELAEDAVDDTAIARPAKPNVCNTKNARTCTYADQTFFTWLGEGRVKRALDVCKLGKILAHPRAHDVFKATPPEFAFKHALEVLHAEHPEKIAGTPHKKLHEIRQKLQKLTAEELHELRRTKEGKDLVRAAMDEMRSVAQRVGVSRRNGSKLP